MEEVKFPPMPKKKERKSFFKRTSTYIAGAVLLFLAIFFASNTQFFQGRLSVGEEASELIYKLDHAVYVAKAGAEINKYRPIKLFATSVLDTTGVRFQFKDRESELLAESLNIDLDAASGTLTYKNELNSKRVISSGLVERQDTEANLITSLQSSVNPIETVYRSGILNLKAVKDGQTIAVGDVDITILHDIDTNGEGLYNYQTIGDLFVTPDQSVAGENISIINLHGIDQGPLRVLPEDLSKFREVSSIRPKTQGPGIGPNRVSEFIEARQHLILAPADLLYSNLLSFDGPQQYVELELSSRNLDRSMNGTQKDFVVYHVVVGEGYAGPINTTFAEVVGLSVVRLDFKEFINYAKMDTSSPNKVLDPNYTLEFALNNYVSTGNNYIVANETIKYHKTELSHYLLHDNGRKTLINKYSDLEGTGPDMNQFSLSGINLGEGTNRFELIQTDIFGQEHLSAQHVLYKPAREAIEIVSERSVEDINNNRYTVQAYNFLQGNNLDMRLQVNDLDEVQMTPREIRETFYYLAEANLRPGLNNVVVKYYEENELVASRIQSVRYEPRELTEEEANNIFNQFVATCLTDREAAEAYLEQLAYQAQNTEDTLGQLLLAGLTIAAVNECNAALPADQQYDATEAGTKAAVDLIGLNCTDAEYNRLDNLIDDTDSLTSAEKAELKAELEANYAQCLDPDEDGILNNLDNCPNVSNIDQGDVDNDGIGDACDNDVDNDGILNTDDNCRAVSNQDQSDLDADGLGNVCDLDDDGDAVDDLIDNCPLDSNPNQENLDGDQYGSVCDPDGESTPLPDYDRDGIADEIDNCPAVANPSQIDTDNDGIGDACEQVVLTPAQVTELIEKAEAALAAFLDLSDLDDVRDAEAGVTERLASANQAVNNLPASPTKSELQARVQLLKTEVDKYLGVMDELESFIFNSGHHANWSAGELDDFLQELAEFENKVRALEASNWKQMVLANIANLRNFVTGDSGLINITLGQSPFELIVDTSKPSSRTILNLYKYSTDMTTSNAVYTVDYQIDSTLAAGSYSCEVGVGCNEWTGELKSGNVTAGKYFYRLMVTVDGERFATQSADFELAQSYSFGQNPQTPTPPFNGYSDVPTSAPEFPAIKYVYDLGIMRGTLEANGSRTFRPNETLVRAEAFAIVNRIAGISQNCAAYAPNLDGNMGHFDLSPVIYNPDAAWYLQQIKCSKQFGNGIVQGYSDGSVQPLKQISWAESVKVVLEAGRFGQVLGGPLLPFANPSAQPWWRDYYLFLNSNRIVVPEGTELITRSQLAQLIYALGQRGLLNEQVVAGRLFGS